MTDSNGSDGGHKRPRDRSPGYPGITLEQAIDRAETLYGHERTHAAPASVVMDHWGYTAKSSNGLITLAALKYFGLTTTEGLGAKRMVKLSDLGLRIVQDQRSESSERASAIKDAALRPAIHREVWDHYGGELPSDEAFRFWLINEKRFTENGASEFIRQFRATVAYAGLSASDNVDEDEREDGDDGGPADMTDLVTPPEQRQKPPAGRGLKPQVFNLPLSPTEVAVIQVPAKMNERLWSQMLKVLDAMKPGIVSEDDPEASE
jgi:hypothetical protein